MKADSLIYNIKTLYTPIHEPPLRGANLRAIKELTNAYIAVKNGKIIAVGETDYSQFLSPETKKIDAKGKIALPGFIDAHTHLVHAGSREEEFAAIQQGVPYLDILAGGGGIINTVSKTRATSFVELLTQARKSLNKMLSYGVTTIEAKSGYGLNLATEIKQLQVAQTLHQQGPVHITSTYMGAHAIPLEHKKNPATYINSIIADLPTIKSLGYVDVVDVFCEKDVFSLSETEKILTVAKNLGFKVRLHADELEALGGAGLGVKLEAISVDHLINISDKDIVKLGQSNTFACLLPGTSFYLQKPFAKARMMIDNNVAVCVAGDYNPGSCPTENFQLIMQLAASYLKLSPEEVLNAVTINPAHLLNLSNQKGSLTPGKDADILLLDAPNLAYIMYHFGINHVNDVFIKGKQVVKNKRIEGETK
ncbi:MAG: imidazolonepropionase [Acholeplasmataceae bacterium]|jgi:imidazolonepropionase|nr:imidazolonepropionase [Acholeplasmataceae bacterium]